MSENESAEALSVSVIIPALNEEKLIAETVERCRDGTEALEIVVADGGSSDRTAERALAAGARVVLSPAGRARQMNAGAKESKGEALLFLHADSVPPAGFVTILRRALADPTVVGGAFSMKVDDPSRLMRLVSKLSTLRSRVLGMPYGDQGIFARRDAFEELGGYSEIPLLEDADLCCRLKRSGRLRILPEAVLTSSRRWRKEGAGKVILRNWGIGLAYACGVSPTFLARLYGPPVR